MILSSRKYMYVVWYCMSCLFYVLNIKEITVKTVTSHSRSLLKFTLERTPSPKKGHLLAEEDDSSDEGLDTSEMWIILCKTAGPTFVIILPRNPELCNTADFVFSKDLTQICEIQHGYLFLTWTYFHPKIWINLHWNRMFVKAVDRCYNRVPCV